MRTFEPKTAVTPAPERELVVRVEGVNRHFDGPVLVRALTDVSFAVFRGEVLALLGPRGSGKSTTLRILAGRLRPSEGKVKVFGCSPRRRRIRRRIGYLPDDADGVREQFLAQFIGFLRDVVGWRQNDRTMPVEVTIPGNLRSRLTRILLQNPELVLLDEPFSGLDSDGCQELKELIATLAQSGKTVILSGDSLCYAKDVCSRLLLFSAGRVEATGTLAQLLDTPGAVRFLGQLLPEATAQRVLQTLREDLLVPQAQSAIPEAVPVQETQTISQLIPPQSCRSAPSADQILRTLVKSPPVEPRSCPPGEPTTQVNHDLLAALSKPALANPPPRTAEE